MKVWLEIVIGISAGDPDGSLVQKHEQVTIRVELLPGFKFTGKMVKIMEFTGKIGKTGKR
jgi:hypothetical protein